MEEGGGRVDRVEGVRRLSWMIVIGWGLIQIFSQSILL